MMSETITLVLEDQMSGTSDKCEEVITSVYDLCRLCMSKESSSTKMMHITDSYPLGSSTLLSEMIADCLLLRVSDNVSNRMTQVCEDCVVDLYTFSDFKKRCTDVDRRLRQIILQNDKISEAQALFGPEIFSINCEEQESGDDPSTVCDTSCTSYNINQIRAENSPETSEVSSFSEIDVTIDDQGNFQFSSQSRDVTGTEVSGATNKLGCQKSISSTSVDGLSIDSNKIQLKVRQQAETEELNDTEVLSEYIGENEEIHLSLNGESNVVKVVKKVPSSSIYGELAVSRSQSKAKQSGLNKRISIPMPEVLVVINEEGQKQLAFRCQECGKTFNNRILHRRHVAAHISQKGCVCQYCDKWFPVRSALDRHERIHSGEKPHTCILCNRSFSQKEILQRHILTHTDEKPFSCPHCDKGYTQKEALNAHIKNTHQHHQKVLQYPCPLCEKAFCHPSGLSRHMQSHTGKRYGCSVCNQHFSDRSSLRRHQRKAHSGVNNSCSRTKSVLPTNSNESYYQLLHEPF